MATIEEKLNELKQIKLDIKQAINQVYGEEKVGDCMRDYADAILHLCKCKTYQITWGESPNYTINAYQSIDGGATYTEVINNGDSVTANSFIKITCTPIHEYYLFEEWVTPPDNAQIENNIIKFNMPENDVYIQPSVIEYVSVLECYSKINNFNNITAAISDGAFKKKLYKAQPEFENVIDMTGNENVYYTILIPYAFPTSNQTGKELYNFKYKSSTSISTNPINLTIQNYDASITSEYISIGLPETEGSSTVQQDYTDSDTGIKYKVYSVRNMPSSQSVTEFRFTIGKYSA